ncbi:MAG: 16S rRNA (guanine(527)-N(7))-methyltransferase RsmG [Geminicoccaceae bacterium]|nr:16S rRNA (guanine(527)-N(7))-methyltransferase RsmG [Geminicoccaceae bacterium]
MSAKPAEPLAPDEFRRALGPDLDVSRETLERLEAYWALLLRWQPRINLVGKATLSDPWRRHMLDSAQLLSFVPSNTAHLLDMGSGAGFPGLVLAILGVERVSLVEADQRKAAFLREAARVAGCTGATVFARRLEDLDEIAPVVTARALAPLPRLLDWAHGRLAPNGRCLFLKGRQVADELTAAEEQWTMRARVAKSCSDPDGRILIIDEVRRR